MMVFASLTKSEQWTKQKYISFSDNSLKRHASKDLEFMIPHKSAVLLSTSTN